MFYTDIKSGTINVGRSRFCRIKEEIYKEDKECSLLESLKRAHNITEQILKEKILIRN